MTALVIVTFVMVMGAAVALIIWMTQRRNRLRSRFGVEYDRTVEAGGSRRAAERELLDRQDRVEHMNIRPLDPAARAAYHAEWAAVQERFVDTPQDALSDADQILSRVMTDRGYDTQDYPQQVADLSVEHSSTLEHYRAAHDISVRAADKETSTEELRQAIVHYRTLFEDLLEAAPGDTAQDTLQGEREPRYQTAAGDPGASRKS